MASGQKKKMHSGLSADILEEKDDVSDLNFWVILFARHSLCHIALFAPQAGSSGHLVRDSTSTPPAWFPQARTKTANTRLWLTTIAETPFVQNAAGTCCKAASLQEVRQRRQKKCVYNIYIYNIYNIYIYKCIFIQSQPPFQKRWFLLDDD